VFSTVGVDFTYVVSVNDSNGDDVTVTTSIPSSQSTDGHLVTLTAQLNSSSNFTNLKFTVIAKASVTYLVTNACSKFLFVFFVQKKDFV